MVNRMLTFALAAVQDSPAVDAGERTVSGVVVPFGVPVDRGFFKSVFSAEGTQLPDNLATVKLHTDHDWTRPVGYGTAAEFRPDGLWMSFAVPEDHPRSAAYLADLDANLRDGFSIGIEPDDDTHEAIFRELFDPTGEPVQMSGVVREVSGVSVPAFNDARADHAARPLLTFSTPTPEGPEMPQPPAPPAPTSPPAAPPAAPVQLPTIEELASQVAAHMRNMQVTEPHPLSQFSSLTDWFIGVREHKVQNFALTQTKIADVPGLMPPSWLTEVQGIIDRGRPVITAMGGGGSLGDSGMEIDWPYVNVDISTLVAEQVTELTQVNSVKIPVLKGTAPLHTFAGVSEISYQVLLRSSPSYRAVFDRIMALGYAATQENFYEDALVSAATHQVFATAATAMTAAQIKAQLFAASRKVRTATGAPADIVAVASDVFDAWGSLDTLQPPQYGTNNVPGTTSAATLRINVSGLEITEAPYMANGSVVVTNELAASFRDAGPYAVEQDQVAILGKDVGIWGMGAATVTMPAGVILIATA